MNKTIVTVVIEFEGVIDEDTVLHSVSNMMAGNLFHDETYSVVEIDYLDEQ